MSWANVYIGLPYRDLGRDRTGLDCWGLVRLVYGEELGLGLPSYAGDYTSAEEVADVAQAIAGGLAGGAWQPQSEREAPRPFEVLLFRRGRWGAHLGVAVDARLMLHVARGEQAKIEPWAAPLWKSRFMGRYRHVQHPLERAS